MVTFKASRNRRPPNNVVCSNAIKRVGIMGETHLSVRSDESVDLEDVDLIKLLQGLLDLSLVGLDIYDELRCH